MLTEGSNDNSKGTNKQIVTQIELHLPEGHMAISPAQSCGAWLIQKYGLGMCSYRMRLGWRKVACDPMWLACEWIVWKTCKDGVTQWWRRSLAHKPRVSWWLAGTKFRGILRTWSWSPTADFTETSSLDSPFWELRRSKVTLSVGFILLDQEATRELGLSHGWLCPSARKRCPSLHWWQPAGSSWDRDSAMVSVWVN